MRCPDRRRPRPSRVLVCTLVVAGLAVTDSPASAQPATLRVELAATAGTPWVEDGNGVTVRQGVGAAVGVAIALRSRTVALLRTPLAPVVTVRASTTPLRAAQGDATWGVGRSRQLDLGLGGRVTLRDIGDASAALVISRLDGPT